MPLLTVRLPRDATLEVALRTLGLPASDVDTAYGLIALDPEQGLYALRVTDSAATRLTAAAEPDITVFADPRIETSGEDEQDQPRQ
ncbi:hypothetical protein [Nocardia sp. NBC_00511]|uniref:hypothetical protein n=1 Tax=Nocardia sp. NBC_00511 TaxID=2903591 RepID=UPI0030E28D83